MRAPALTFGPGSIHFSRDAAAPGEEIALCLDDVTWLRVCPGDTVTWLTPANVADRQARRLDLEPHRISHPASAGKIAAKCRPWKVPASLQPGVWRLEGYTTNTCQPFGVEVRTALPAANLVVRRD